MMKQWQKITLQGLYKHLLCHKDGINTRVSDVTNPEYAKLLGTNRSDLLGYYKEAQRLYEKRLSEVAAVVEALKSQNEVQYAECK